MLLLNVNHLNRQAEQAKNGLNKLGEIYKFPFAILTSQDWDIEHIDSFTKNGLKRVDDQEKWLDTAMADLEIQLNEDEKTKNEIQLLRENGKLMDAINKLRILAKETDAPEEVKNNIGI